MSFGPRPPDRFTQGLAQGLALGRAERPADAVAASSDVKMLGSRIRVPRGLLRVAAERRVAVTVFTVGIDLENGTRQLTIHTLPMEENIEILMGQVFGKMEAVLQNAPAAWHFWSEADRFFI